MTAATNMAEVAKEEAELITGELDAREKTDLDTAYGVVERGRRPREYGPALSEMEKAQKTRAKRRILDVVDRGLMDLVSVYRDAIAVGTGAHGTLVNEEIRGDVETVARTSTPELNLRRIQWIFDAREQMLEFNVQPRPGPRVDDGRAQSARKAACSRGCTRHDVRVKDSTTRAVAALVVLALLLAGAGLAISLLGGDSDDSTELQPRASRRSSWTRRPSRARPRRPSRSSPTSTARTSPGRPAAAPSTARSSACRSTTPTPAATRSRSRSSRTPRTTRTHGSARWWSTPAARAHPARRTPSRPRTCSARPSPTTSTSSGSTRAAPASRPRSTACPTAQMDAFLAADPVPDDAEETDELVDGLDDFWAGCVANSTGGATGIVAHVTTIEAARDMDVLRSALGEAQLSYFGASYGTKLGATYADLFPDKVGRLVLDGAVDVSLDSVSLSLGQAEGFERALTAYVDDCVSQGDCFLGDSTEEGLQTIKDLLADIDAQPLPDLGRAES